MNVSIPPASLDPESEGKPNPPDGRNDLNL